MNARAHQPEPGPPETDVAFASIPVGELLAGDRRMEAESYLSEGYLIRKQVEASGLPIEPLGDLAEVWQPSRLKGVQVAAEYGQPFLTATQVFDIRPRARKWLAPGQVDQLEKRYVEPGWILVTCSGSVGDSIMSYSAHQNTIISHDLLRVQGRDAEVVGYLYAFLRTRFGRAMMRSSKYGSIIKHLEPEHLDKMPIPLLGKELRRTVGQRISEVFELRDEALRLFRDAETRYEKEVAGHGGEPCSEISYTVPASRAFGRQRRLDAYHYNPDAERILRQLRNTGREVVPLSSVADGVFGVPRFKHVYAEDGIPYLDSEDLFKVNPEITKFIPRATKKNHDDYYVEREWLLMACSGQIYGLNGSVVLANEWHESKIVSNHVIRIVPSAGSIRPGYLRMVLGHPTLGWPLVIRCAFGTSVPEIAPEDVWDLPVIRLESSVENEIAQLVEKADELRLRADQEEDAVISTLEVELHEFLSLPAGEISASPASHKR
jgi:hypothetical protein